MAMDELIVTKLEMVEGWSSGDDDGTEEAEEAGAEEAEDVRLRNKVGEWRPVTSYARSTYDGKFVDDGVKVFD